ncbi:adenylate kinase [bacterium]|nr:adenylate kinase [bacterium]
MIIVFLGPPGSGKGTQADILHDNHGFFHFDTGSRLRAEIASGSELGQRIASFTNAGKLVPIEIIKEMILKFLREADAERIMFDGFPRNLAQAEVLDEGLKEYGDDLDYAVYLEIDEDNLLARIVNRRFCSKCGEIYNLISKPPKQAGICDNDGAELTQRKDDTEEVFGTRLKVYLEETKPVLDYYRQAGKLHTIDGDYDIEDVSRAVAELLGV